MKICELEIPNHNDLVALIGILNVAGYKTSIDYRQDESKAIYTKKNYAIIESKEEQDASR
jgi:hypothetical protein